MRYSFSARKYSGFAVMTVFIALLSPLAVSAQTGATPVPTKPELSAPPQKSLEDWHDKMSATPLDHKGCFVSSFPNATWKEVPCEPAPLHPQLGQKGTPLSPLVVGGGTDWFATAAGGNITAATGSFDSVSVANEYGEKIGAPPYVHPNTYTLQLNTNALTNITVCQNHSGCLGWEQFIFENEENSSNLYIQYWLYNYSSGSCPDSTWTYTGGSGFLSGCVKNALYNSPKSLPVIPAANLGQWKLTGIANSNGFDQIQLSTTGQIYAATGDNAVDVAEGGQGGWTLSEFNIFGDGNASTAYFNIEPSDPPANIQVRLNVNNGTSNAPSCTPSYYDLYTAETNNLTRNSCNPSGGSSPSIVYSESGGGALSPGLSIGDPHLLTFSKVHYDFQGSGDFIIVTNEGSKQGVGDFVVQTRQKLIPSNVAYNIGVATKMGDTNVAICIPNHLEVNGKLQDLPDGNSLPLPGAVLVSRRGSLFNILGPGGEAVHAQTNPSSIDVSVSLGLINGEDVRGLLGSAANQPLNLGIRNGAALPEIPTFKEFYSYGDSWRVQPAEALLCATGAVTPGIPSKLVTDENLPPAERTRVRSICLNAGVKEGPFLDDCMLDVSLLESSSATAPFISVPAPIKVITPTFP